MSNKKSQMKGTTMGFIYGLLFIFALGLIYIVFNQILTVNVTPIIDAQLDSQVDKSPYFNQTVLEKVQANNTRNIAYFNSLPYIILFVLAILVIMIAIRAKSDEVQ